MKAKKPLAVKNYGFTLTSTPALTSTSQSNGDITTDGKQEDKKKGGKAKKRSLEDAMGAHGISDGDDSKKVKDSQKATSKKLVVSLDEGCYMGG